MTVGGGVVAFEQVGEQVESDLQRAEMLAAPILFLFSLLVFRSVVAALLPLAVGMTTILITFSLLRIVNAFERDVDVRDQPDHRARARPGDRLLAVHGLALPGGARDGRRDARTRCAPRMRTAGRTVLFSAVTVAAAMAAMLVFPLRFLYSMGVGGVLVALTAAVVSLTLLPALLAVLGPRVNALVAQALAGRHASATPPTCRRGPWYRLSRAVMRRPAPIAIATATLLIVLGLPFLRIEFTGVDASVLPKERSARVVDDAIRAEFPPGPTSPMTVVAGVGERGRPGGGGLRAATAGPRRRRRR